MSFLYSPFRFFILFIYLLEDPEASPRTANNPVFARVQLLHKKHQIRKEFETFWDCTNAFELLI